MLKHHIAGLVCCWPLVASASLAEKPIEGGLGVRLGNVIAPSHLGAEVQEVAFAFTPDNRKFSQPQPLPGQPLPWRHLLQTQIPKPFRELAQTSFVMLDTDDTVMRVVSRIEFEGCEDELNWLTQTLTKKYDVKGDLQVEHVPPGYTSSYRVVFSSKQIDVHCGPNLILDYTDFGALHSWQESQKIQAIQHSREQAAMEKRRLVLKRRRANQFADHFTLGDRYSLQGAFGIAFAQPFAPNSTQKFPVDQPFTVVLPEMPDDFADAELVLEIGPDRAPVSIRARFRSVSFERVSEALRAKYGSPVKASSRHVIHKVSGNHAIIKKLDAQTIELVFLDGLAQAAQRQRSWEAESEGL